MVPTRIAAWSKLVPVMLWLRHKKLRASKHVCSGDQNTAESSLVARGFTPKAIEDATVSFFCEITPLPYGCFGFGDHIYGISVLQYTRPRLVAAIGYRGTTVGFSPNANIPRSKWKRWANILNQSTDPNIQYSLWWVIYCIACVHVLMFTVVGFVLRLGLWYSSSSV